MDKAAVGDKVELNSGGPIMRVVEVSLTRRGMEVVTEWERGPNYIERQVFNVACVKPVRPERLARQQAYG